ncbi:MAG: adenosylhomocysteinase, partial [Verrucomicrobiota bacterium]
MSSTISTARTSGADFKVKDLSLADWGRKEIIVAEKEMPGLIAIREKYAAG